MPRRERGGRWMDQGAGHRWSRAACGEWVCLDCGQEKWMPPTRCTGGPVVEVEPVPHGGLSRERRRELIEAGRVRGRVQRERAMRGGAA